MNPKLCRAAEENDVIALDQLIAQEGIGVLAQLDDIAMTALHKAAISGSTEVVNRLLEYGVEIDAQDEEDWTPFMGAILAGNFDIAISLLEHGANGDCFNERHIGAEEEEVFIPASMDKVLRSAMEQESWDQWVAVRQAHELNKKAAPCKVGLLRRF